MVDVPVPRHKWRDALERHVTAAMVLRFLVQMLPAITLCVSLYTTGQRALQNGDSSSSVRYHACTDEDSLCDAWAASGECESNPAFMLDECRRSCSNCPPAPPPLGTVSAPAAPPPPEVVSRHVALGGLAAIAAIGLLSAGLTIVPFCTFKRPTFVHPAVETTDLALCFHINLYNKAYMGIAKLVLIALTIGAAAVLIGASEQPSTIIQSVWLPLLTTFASAFSLFPKTLYNKLTYAQFQQDFLSDCANFTKHLSFGGIVSALLAQNSKRRLLEAFAMEIQSDHEKLTAAATAAQPPDNDTLSDAAVEASAGARARKCESRVVRFFVQMIPTLSLCASLFDIVQNGHTRVRDEQGIPRELQDTIYDDDNSRMGLYVVAVVGACGTLLTAIPFCTFSKPVWVDPTTETVDLALCFHVNVTHRYAFYAFSRTLLTLFLAGASGYLVSQADKPRAALEAIWFPLLTGFASCFFLFPKTTHNSMTYRQYQAACLSCAGGRTNHTGHLTKINLLSSLLAQGSADRVLEAFSREAQADSRSQIQATNAASPASTEKVRV